jgi:hypothetical protein
MKPMIRLALIALGAGLLSFGCLGCAYVLATSNDSGSREIISREIPWDDGRSLSLGVRSVVRYVQAEGPGKVIARGPHRSVSTLVVNNGEIRDQLLHTGATLEITVIAPAISEFHVSGGSRLSIEAYNQKSLTLSTEGSATVDALGRADDVSVEMTGSGVVNLSRFTADAATASLGGMSTLVVGPSLTANLNVRNFASAVLLTRPGEFSSSLADSGRIVDAAVR